MKLTKIIATIGPACESEEMIAKMITSGVNVIRFNFKHNSVDWHSLMIERVNAVAKKLKTRVGTLIDLQGPEIRIRMAQESLDLTQGEEILLGEEALETNQKGFSITHPEIISHLKQGQSIIADDGAFEFTIVEKGELRLLKCLTTGTLKQRKTLNIPGANFPFPVLIDRDLEGISLAKRQEIDYVALSFVRSAQDVDILRKEMSKQQVKAKIVAKIETQKSIEDIDAIVSASDGVMVARGDLGVESPVERVPFYQKMIIKKCIEQGKFAITATQMLQSMIQSPQPTRAEVSDIANACYDLSDAVMLSGESASGLYPLRAIDVMNRTITYNETKFALDTRKVYGFNLSGQDSLIAESAYELYLESVKRNTSIKAFVVFTHSGATARLVSAYRPSVPVFAFCPDRQIADSLTMHYGIYPLIQGKKYKKSLLVSHSHVLAGISHLRDNHLITPNDKIIVIHGDFWDISGGSSTIKLVTCQ